MPEKDEGKNQDPDSIGFPYPEGTPEYNFVVTLHDALRTYFENNALGAAIVYLFTLNQREKAFDRFTIDGVPLLEHIILKILDCVNDDAVSYVSNFVHSIPGTENERLKVIIDRLLDLSLIQNFGEILTTTLRVDGTQSYFAENFQRIFFGVFARFLEKTYSYKDSS